MVIERTTGSKNASFPQPPGAKVSHNINTPAQTFWTMKEIVHERQRRRLSPLCVCAWMKNAKRGRRERARAMSISEQFGWEKRQHSPAEKHLDIDGRRACSHAGWEVKSSAERSGDGTRNDAVAASFAVYTHNTHIQTSLERKKKRSSESVSYRF